MNVIILCGGLSTRLGDITKSIPKILVDVGGKTILDWQLEKIAELGVDMVYLAAGHLSEVLASEVGTDRHGMRLVHIVEPTKLGTGGAIKHAIATTQNAGPYVILNGDILYTHSFADMYASLDGTTEGVILGTHVSDAATYGTLEYNDTNQLQAFKEKEGKQVPGYINGGMYIFTEHALSHFPDQDTFSIEYEVFPYMRNLYVYASDSPWVDIGVPDRLAWAREHYASFMNH